MRLSAMCSQLAALAEAHLGGVDGACRESSVLLAYRLRRDGADARVCCSAYLYYDDYDRPVREGHAHVRFGAWTLDPTRAQFYWDREGHRAHLAALKAGVPAPEPRPQAPPALMTLTAHTAGSYGELVHDPQWSPPARPDLDSAREFLYTRSIHAAPALQALCEAFGCPELTP